MGMKGMISRGRIFHPETGIEVRWERLGGSKSFEELRTEARRLLEQKVAAFKEGRGPQHPLRLVRTYLADDFELDDDVGGQVIRIDEFGPDENDLERVISKPVELIR